MGDDQLADPLQGKTSAHYTDYNGRRKKRRCYGVSVATIAYLIGARGLGYFHLLWARQVTSIWFFLGALGSFHTGNRTNYGLLL